MTTVISDSWSKKNQQYLTKCMEQIKNLLECKIKNEKNTGIQSDKQYWKNDKAFVPSIEYICKAFGLSSFERSILLMCAAIELDSQTGQLFVKIHENPNINYPTFSLAFAILSDAHWSAILPTGPLRRFKLIYTLGQPQIPITKCQLQIDERVLHYITGISYLDQELKGIIKPVEREIPITDSQKKIADAVLYSWKTQSTMFHVQLVGNDETSKKVVANQVCRGLGLTMWEISSDLIPTKPEDLESLASLWARESVLLNAALYVDATEIDPNLQKTLSRFIVELTSLGFISTRERWPANELYQICFDVSKPTKDEQRELWNTFISESLGKYNSQHLENEVSGLVNHFDLSASAIQMASTEALTAMNRGETISSSLWSSTLKTARLRLSELAVQIKSTRVMDDVILPEREKLLLKSIITNVRQRYKVYEEWGFGKNEEKGLGITTLFVGDSGTGKTMTAGVIASELNLDLFKIDLSMVVNKYIGETEKNLKKIFDAAEVGGAILLFDEADALFGKRSEVKDSHDRYANIEVGYLLQRMEEYRGLAILTTNMKDSLDRAFLRRLRFVVNFPAPDKQSREEIWKRIFPRSVPVSDEINYSKLAQLDITGGNIRNIALGAAFFAAEDNIPINIHHIRLATIEEYGKMNRPIPNGEWDSC